MEIQTIDCSKDGAGLALVNSLHETGFAILRNHQIDYSLVQELYKEWGVFFNNHSKFNYPYDKKKGDGYVGIATSEIAKGAKLPDLKEFYQLYFPHGRYPKELSNNTAIYFKNIFELANRLLNWLDYYTPSVIKNNFSELLVNMMSIEQTMLRVLHYPQIQETRGAVRAAAHEDINLITLLPASNQTGLQVKTKDNTWLDVGTNAGEIIVNVGDMLQECSKHYYVSTTHRVINQTQQHGSRFSMPLFVHPRADVFLSKRYSQAEFYLKERLKELGLLD